jgi:hypothetical protein
MSHDLTNFLVTQATGVISPYARSPSPLRPHHQKSNVHITLCYLGRILHCIDGGRCDILVLQQHCGGNTLVLYKGRVAPRGKWMFCVVPQACPSRVGTPEKVNSLVLTITTLSIGAWIDFSKIVCGVCFNCSGIFFMQRNLLSSPSGTLACRLGSPSTWMGC